MKKYNEKNNILEDTIIDKEYNIPSLKKINFVSNHKIISFISEYMSLSLNEKISRYLISKNIGNIKNPLTSDTLFHYLCINDANYPLIKLMKPNFEEIENRNNLGQNLLHVAVQNKSIKIANYLIDNNANINSKDNRNNTSLHIAVKNEDYNMVKLLMKYNPKLNILNNNKETPLDIARKKGNKLLINYLENNSKKKKKNLIINNIESSHDYKHKDNLRNTFNKSNLYNIQNISMNECSIETKNETDNQSLNIYTKKIISKDNKTQTPLPKKIKCNRTISLDFSFGKSGNTPTKDISNKIINDSSPKISGSKLIYKKNSPKTFNNQRRSFKEISKINNKKYELNLFTNPAEFNRKNSEDSKCNPKLIKNELNIKIQKNKNQKYYTNNEPKIKLKNRVLQKFEYNNNFVPLSLYQNYEYNKSRMKKRKQIPKNKTYNDKKENNIRKEDKEKLIEFLKEIGMIQYIDLLIEEGFDDINLIIKQMNKGFPSLYETLKEIGINSPGDIAKILIRMQEISHGFNFDFPFEQVYFKNNKSIQKWLNKEGLSQYNKNFIEAGYQSLELLLIQMASKYKINEKILKEDIYIINDEDRKKILKSLIINSEKYINELRKSENIQRSYSKMVKNDDSRAFCIII